MTTDQETTIRETAKRLGWNEERQGSTGTKYWLSDVYIMTRYSLNGRLTFTQRARGSDREEVATVDKYKTLLRWLDEGPSLTAARNGQQAQPVTDAAAAVPPPPQTLETIVRALDALAKFADAAGADPDGGSANRLHADLRHWAAVLSDQYTADYAASVALGERLYKHAQAMENPSVDDLHRLGSAARFAAEKANEQIAALARGRDDE